MIKGLFLFADYYDATTATRRVLLSTRQLFDDIEFVYWARLGKPRHNIEDLYSDINFTTFTETAKPRSFQVILLFVKFQLWLLKVLIKKRPNFLVAFTFYTIFPALIYKYIYNQKCKVIYDPRDYVSVSFRINILIALIIRFIDNIFIKISDFVIFPDKQYFIHYGMFHLKKDKYLIIPNSAEDLYEKVIKNDVIKKYNFDVNKKIIPVLGYFSETRGEKILFELIKRKISNLHFVFAGDIRDEKHLAFFENNKDNVTYLDKVPYLDALSIMYNSAVIPQLYDPETVNNVYAYPTKYYDCLMIGKPVIVSNGQIDVSKEITNNNFGWSIDYYDTDALQKIILQIIENPNLIDSEKLRLYFLNNYDYNIWKIRLKEVYSRFI